MESAMTSIGKSCFTKKYKSEKVVLVRITNTIYQKVFLNSQSVEYVGYDDLTESLHLEDNNFGMDLPHIIEFDYDDKDRSLSFRKRFILD